MLVQVTKEDAKRLKKQFETVFKREMTKEDLPLFFEFMCFEKHIHPFVAQQIATIAKDFFVYRLSC